MSDFCLMAPKGSGYSTAPFYNFGYGDNTFEEYLASPAIVKITPQIAGNWLYNVKKLSISNAQQFQGDPEGGILVATGTATTSLTQKDVGAIEIQGGMIRPRTSCIYIPVEDVYFETLFGWSIDVTYSSFEGYGDFYLRTPLGTFLGLSFFMYNDEFYAYFGGGFPNSRIEVSMNQITVRVNSIYAEANWVGSTEVFTILETQYPVA